MTATGKMLRFIERHDSERRWNCRLSLDRIESGHIQFVFGSL